MTFKQVLNKFKENRPGQDVVLIEKAYHFAEKAHQGKKRLNGEYQIEHLLATAHILAQLKLDAITVAAGLLHDTLEYTDTPVEQLEKEFGQEVVFLIKGISESKQIKYKYKDKDRKEKERQTENLKKILLAMSKDIRVVLIKLANRIHNMQTLNGLPKEKRKRIAQDTLEIYAPLANRLGIGEIKGQLEDLSFPYAYPTEYQLILSDLPEKYKTRNKYLNRVKPIIEKRLKEEGVKILEVHSRAKHHYSLFKKLKKHDMDWSKIYDLVALRIIVPDIESCYASLGIIHKKWKPLPGRIKDYIAIPKPNGYQSLHTTVFCEEGKITEIQIRTPKMHKEAEYGIAAHWYYDEKKGLTSQIKDFFWGQKKKQDQLAPGKELAWIKQLQEWQKESFKTPEEFIDSLKVNLLKDRIFIFTPKGDIIDLPEGANSIDFAYAIHTDIGHHCAGAKVDGKLVSLDKPLKNGQMVEIVIQKNKKPSRDWLNIAKTNQAKSKIRSALKLKD